MCLFQSSYTFSKELSSIVNFRGVDDHRVWENRIHATQEPIHFWTWISDQRVTENASKHSGIKIQHGGKSGKQSCSRRFHVLNSTPPGRKESKQTDQDNPGLILTRLTGRGS